MYIVNVFILYIVQTVKNMLKNYKTKGFIHTKQTIQYLCDYINNIIRGHLDPLDF